MGKTLAERLFSNERPGVGGSNKPEAEFEAKMKAKGWTLLRKGWPDFACFKGDRLVLVEVKQKRSHRLKTEQLDLLRAFAKHGIECYKWDTEKGFEQITPLSEDVPHGRISLPVANPERDKRYGPRLPIYKGPPPKPT